MALLPTAIWHKRVSGNRAALQNAQNLVHALIAVQLLEYIGMCTSLCIDAPACIYIFIYIHSVCSLCVFVDV